MRRRSASALLPDRRGVPGGVIEVVSRFVPEIGKRPSKGPLTCGYLVGDTGFEPMTSSVSGKRATTAPIALARPTTYMRAIEVETGFEPV